MKTILIREQTHSLRAHPHTSADHSALAARRAGFTLLELLIVISMMIFITTIAVMNYFGAMRSAGYTAVSSDVFSALVMARQRACINGQPVIVYLRDATNYVFLAPMGTITMITAGVDSDDGRTVFWDQYGSPKLAQSNLIVNMNNPRYTAKVESAADDTTLPLRSYVNVDGIFDSVAGVRGGKIVVNLSPPPIGWNEGDQYGTEVLSPSILPKGFVFETPTPNSVLFRPDGTVDIVNGISSIVVKEAIGQSSDNHVTFTITSDGHISQTQ
jgi:type II secretory pathway pseudopilin PulG